MGSFKGARKYIKKITDFDIADVFIICAASLHDIDEEEPYYVRFIYKGQKYAIFLDELEKVED